MISDQMVSFFELLVLNGSRKYMISVNYFQRVISSTIKKNKSGIISVQSWSVLSNDPSR